MILSPPFICRLCLEPPLVVESFDRLPPTSRYWCETHGEQIPIGYEIAAPSSVEPPPSSQIQAEAA